MSTQSPDVETTTIDGEQYVTRTQFFTMYGRMDDRVKELERENKMLREEFARLKDQLDSLDGHLSTQKTSKVDKHVAIIEYAGNQLESGMKGVAVEAKEIVGAVGCSMKYSYQLMEDMAATYSFASLRDVSDKPKAVRIEFEGTSSEELSRRVRRQYNGKPWNVSE